MSIFHHLDILAEQPLKSAQPDPGVYIYVRLTDSSIQVTDDIICAMREEKQFFLIKVFKKIWELGCNVIQGNPDLVKYYIPKMIFYLFTKKNGGADRNKMS